MWKSILRGKTEKGKPVSEDWLVIPPPFPGDASETLELSRAKD